MYKLRVALLVFLLPVGFFYGLLLTLAYLVVTMGFTILFDISVNLVGLVTSLVTLTVGCLILYAIWWWLRNGRPTIPFVEIVQAVAAVMKESRREASAASDAALAEGGLVDLDTQNGEQEPSENHNETTGVLVDVTPTESPKDATAPPATTEVTR